MKKSPVYPRYEAGDHGFDLQVDFSQFLEEAREHASGEHCAVAPQNPDEAGRKQSHEAKKNRKSWKRSLFSWWKPGKKSNSGMEPPSISHQSKPRRGPISSSGPIHGTGGGAGSKHSRPISGPLPSLFHATKRVENEMRYVYLDKLNAPNCVQSYGPIYLVT